MPARKVDVGSVQTTAMLLAGKAREEIIGATNFSAGAQDEVSKIIRATLGDDLYDSLRGVFKLADKQIFEPQEVANGSKIAAILKQSNIDIQEFASWISPVYNSALQEYKITPEEFGNVMSLIGSLLRNEKIPPRELPQNVKEKVDELGSLTRQVAEEQETLTNTAARRKEEEEALTKELDENKVTRIQLEEFKEADRQLAPFGLSASNIPKLAPVLKNVESTGFSAELITQSLAEVGGLRKQSENLLESIKQQKIEDSALRANIAFEGLAYPEYLEVRKNGFGAPQLSVLRKTVSGIMKLNGLDDKKAAEKLTSDIASQYDLKLGFEKQIERGKGEVENIENTKKMLQSEVKIVQKNLEVLRSDETALINGNTSLRAQNEDLMKRTKGLLNEYSDNVRKHVDKMKEMAEKLDEARRIT